jgi:protein-S-isoprenylcysteine O-methyltransferase Ste14
MHKKMSLIGVAGKILIVLVLATAVTEGISLLLAPMFQISENYDRVLLFAILFAAVGFSLNLVAAFGMMKAHRKNELATTGLYAIFLHPMYTCQLLLTVPGLLLLLNSWLALAAVVPAFIAFKIFAKEEDRYLEETFGAQYRTYRNKVQFRFL